MVLPEQRINTGSFVPTTNIWDVSRLLEVEVTSPEFKELLVRLYQNVNALSLALNTKDSALYFQEEFVSGQVWTNLLSSDPNDQIQGFRKVIMASSNPLIPDPPVLPAGITNFPHGLVPLPSTSATYTGWKFVEIRGVASNTQTLLYYPINYAGVNNIAAFVNATNVVVENNSGIDFDKVIIVLEYIKF